MHTSAYGSSSSYERCTNNVRSRDGEPSHGIARTASAILQEARDTHTCARMASCAQVMPTTSATMARNRISAMLSNRGPSKQPYIVMTGTLRTRDNTPRLGSYAPMVCEYTPSRTKGIELALSAAMTSSRSLSLNAGTLVEHMSQRSSRFVRGADVIPRAVVTPQYRTCDPVDYGQRR